MQLSYIIIITVLAIMSFGIVIILSDSLQYSYSITNPISSPASDSPSQLIFRPWGSENGLVINPSKNGSSVPILKLQGVTGKTPSGFVSQELNYRDQSLSIVLGNVTKFPNDAQVSFSVDIRGLFKNYTIVLVSGRAYPDIWRGDKYYHHLNANANNDINLYDLIASRNGLYLMTKKITLVAEKNIKVDRMDFKIQFRNSQ